MMQRVHNLKLKIFALITSISASCLFRITKSIQSRKALVSESCFCCFSPKYIGSQSRNAVANILKSKKNKILKQVPVCGSRISTCLTIQRHFLFLRISWKNYIVWLLYKHRPIINTFCRKKKCCSLGKLKKCKCVIDFIM